MLSESCSRPRAFKTSVDPVPAQASTLRPAVEAPATFPDVPPNPGRAVTAPRGGRAGGSCRTHVRSSLIHPANLRFRIQRVAARWWGSEERGDLSPAGSEHSPWQEASRTFRGLERLCLRAERLPRPRAWRPRALRTSGGSGCRGPSEARLPPTLFCRVPPTAPAAVTSSSGEPTGRGGSQPHGASSASAPVAGSSTLCPPLSEEAGARKRTSFHWPQVRPVPSVESGHSSKGRDVRSPAASV